MKRERPGFLDQPTQDESSETAAAAVDPNATPAVERPRLFDAAPGAPLVVDGDWHPEAIAFAPRKRSPMALAAIGLGIVLTGWLGVSLAASAIASYQLSTPLGGIATFIYLAGGSLIAAGTLAELRALRSLRRVDHIRAALTHPDVSLEAFRDTCTAWLRTLPPEVDGAGSVQSILPQAESKEQLLALLNNRLANKLRDATRRVGIRSATEGTALVALSPHPSWDGMIVGVYGVRIIRRIAELHGVRPSAVVTWMLLRRVARVAVEIAAIDLAAQTVSNRLLEHTPVVRHLMAAIPGMGDVALRLYRLALAAGRACNPLPP